jgi:hypothetical protein
MADVDTQKAFDDLRKVSADCWDVASKVPDADDEIAYTRRHREADRLMSFFLFGCLVAAGQKRDALEKRIANLEADAVSFQGVWKEGAVYKPKSLVTDHGAIWISLRETASRPPSGDWKLAAKSEKPARTKPGTPKP